MENKFFTFLDPVMKFIDNGQFFRAPFQWLYTLLAGLNLLFPLGVLYLALDNRIFSIAPAKFIFAFIMIFLVVCGLAWFGFQIWWNRRSSVLSSSKDGDEFVAIPVFSHFIQTCGEWLGMFIGVGGCFLTLVVLLFLGGESDLSSIGLGGIVGSSLLGCILFPIYGFLIVVAARVLAEIYRALAAIANNTRK